MVQYLTPFATNDIINVIKQIPVSTQNIECTPDSSLIETDALEPIIDADLGCLCIKSESSSLGGICASSNNVEDIILSVESKRHLQGGEPEPLPFTAGICPNTCDQDLCTCAASTEEGFPDAQVRQCSYYDSTCILIHIIWWCMYLVLTSFMIYYLLFHRIVLLNSMPYVKVVVQRTVLMQKSFHSMTIRIVHSVSVG